MTTARDRPPEEAPEDTSFARGLRVFLTIADRGLVRADELAVLLETPLSTVYRYLRTLTEFGFVDRVEGAYRIGPRLLVGGGSTVSTDELIRRADPVITMLAAESGETAVISRRVGLSVVCLHQQPSDQPLRVVLEVGGATPLGVGAIGRVLLAWAPPDVQDEVLAGGTASDERIDLSAVVDEHIVVTEHELVPSAVMLAAPVLRDDGIVAAVGLLAPSGRATAAWRVRSAGLVGDAAKSIVRALRSAS
jgi:DNA-binding IclR family transcriptional regulator